MSVEFTFNPNPVQKQFIESQTRADLFSSRMGEGKTAALVWASFYHVKHNPGAVHAVIRDTWENLRDTTLKEFFKWFPPGVFGTWNESKKTYTWASGIADGSIMWIGMDDPADAGKLQSRELAGFLIDEPAPAAGSGGVSELIFDVALSRLRQPNMKWYIAKLATNNPDESHWTYKRFVDPGSKGFISWQPSNPENYRNLPTGYYEQLRTDWAHRPDLIERFVDGQYGFQHEGIQVTPEWSDRLHLSTGLIPVKSAELHLLWDFGLNPTCIITQVTPLRQWLVLDSFVGSGIGVEELILNEVKPTLADRYRGFRWKHIGDPAGKQKEQSSASRSAVRSLLGELGGTFRAGPVPFAERREPLRAVLRHTAHGRGIIQVDRVRAREVWQSLRGGWHFHVARSGVQALEPLKDIHSHPGDAMGYGAAVLFPMGRLLARPGHKPSQTATFFGQGGSMTFGPPGVSPPVVARTIGS